MFVLKIFSMKQGDIESVQFMQFDSDENLFVYEPGAGCPAIPCKIPQGFTQDDLNYTTPKLSKFPKVSAKDVHRIVSKKSVKPLSIGGGRR